MLKKKLNLVLVLLFLLFAFVGCKKEDEKKDDEVNFQIKVYDIDGEMLADKAYSTKTYKSVLEALETDLNAVTFKGDYGTSITSIASSIVDSNWYLAIYENGEYASTGVDGLVIDEGDVFAFKAECWNTLESVYGTMDETDVLVDKIIYSYMKNYMGEVVKASTTVSNVDYWSCMAISMMKSNHYDANVFSTKYFKDELKTNLQNETFEGYNGVSYGKYFYSARALGLDLTSFKEAYTNFMASIDDNYNEYQTPFYLSVAKYLDVTNSKIEELSHTSYRAGTTWGLDGLCWEMASLALFNTFTLEDLSFIEAKDQGNGCSTALLLLPLAACNINAREIKDENNVDLVKLIIDNYYDEELNLVKWSASDTTINYSTNQIYASLMAYKAQRDLQRKVNIFA